MWIGAPPLLVVDNENLSFSDIGASQVAFRLGIVEVNAPTPPFEMRFDNVVIRFP
jgi:hypothetical protein